MNNRVNFNKIRTGLVDVPPDQQLAYVQAEIRNISDLEQRDIAENMLLFGMSVNTPPSKRKIVVLIHGIRTHAVWQERLADELTASGDVDVFPIGYGFFDVLSFLCPVITRREPVNKVLRELRTIRAGNPNADISIVAHSFGTYIMSEILSEETDVQLHRLQLCGSIISTKYRWDKVKSRISGLVINDAGTRDYWPVLASVATWGYGTSGTFGFKTTCVNDRYYDCSHSDFFSDEHMRKYWVPLLADGQIIKSSWTTSRPSPGVIISILNIVPVKTILAIGILFFVIRKLGFYPFSHMF